MPRPGADQVIRLCTLLEVRERWGVSEYTVRKAVVEGNLRQVGRPGHQRYYLENEVRALWGPPRMAPEDDPMRL